MLWKTLLLWFALMVLAIVNGTVRVKLIIPLTGEPVGHVISTIMLCGIILCTAWSGIGWIAPSTSGQAWVIGLLWMALTLTFEFGAGHWLFKKSWSELLTDYHLMKGRIWVVVPIVTLIAPWIAARLRGLIGG